MTKTDYYKVLGVPRNANADEIKKAYRRLARQFHPDTAGNDPKTTERFKEVQEAYDVLSNAEKRQMYDQFGHSGPNFGQNHRGGGQYYRPGWGQGTGAGTGAGVNFDFADFFGQNANVPGDIGDIFEQIGARTGRRRQKGKNVEHTVKIEFFEAINGTQRNITLRMPGAANRQKTERLTVKIPAGIKHGAKIRLRGKGQAGAGNEAGDLIITIEIAEHTYFQRQGNDISLEVPITLTEATLGAKVDVPTLEGKTTVTIPPESSSGRKLRLKEKGVKSHKTGKKGDMFLILKIVPPKQIDERSKQLLNELAEMNPQKDIRESWRLD